MSDGSVVTNEKENLKRDLGADFMRAKFAIMNPELTKTLPAYQTASGCVDIVMHTMERYFNPGDNMDYVDQMCELLMRKTMENAVILHKDPENTDARAEVMWAGSLSHNGLTSSGLGQGDWATHNMEHEMGGLFDVAHGAGMAAIWGSWARYVHHAAPHRFVRFAVNVMGVEKDADDEVTIERGIQAVENWYRSIDMPTNMRELGIAPTEEQLAWMAQSAEIKTGGGAGSVVLLKKEDINKIYHMAL
jgi:alcohol dehydrogenase YqhD (iron-dependent ADH family)